MALPSNFDAATFLYLNPELGAYSNILSIELARDYFLDTPTASNMIYNFETLPKDFDGRIFLADNKDGLNVSQLNHTIKMAMSNEGYNAFDIESFSQYLPTVYKDLRLLSNNVFTFKDLDYGITSNNLMVNDDIKINVQNIHFVFSKVTNIDTNLNTFTVSNYHASAFSNPDIKYNLVGHKIFDAERLSKTNYVRNNRSSNPIYGDFSNRFYGLDPGFNPEIYRLFYPDARLMTDEQCVLDYTSRRNNADIRIGKSDEIVKSIDYIYTELRNLRVSCNCKVNGNFILGSNGYEIWVNGITRNYTRPSSNASDDLLITEKASKGYLDQFLTDTMVLTNLIVRSNATFCNSVNMLSNLYVGGVATHCNDMIRIGNLLNTGSVEVSQNISLSNDLIVKNNTTISSNLNVGSNISLSNSLFVNNTAFFGESICTSNTLFIGSNVSLSNNLFVGSNAEVIGNLAVRGDFTLDGNFQMKSSLYVGSNITASNNMYVQCNLYVGSNVAVSNNLTVNNEYYCLGDSYFNKNAIVSQNIVGCNNLTLSSNCDIYGNLISRCNLQILGTSTLSNDALIYGNLTCNSNATVLGIMKIGACNNIGSLLLDVLGGVRADEYFLSSDVRVKHNIEALDTEKCVEFIEKSPVIKYNLKYDYLSKPRYGFLAHKLEELDKNVICNITDFIPDMMKQVSVTETGWICLENHSYTKNTKVKILYEGKSHSVTLLDVKKNKIKINSSFGGKDIFIYGQEIQDFKTIDYTQMFAITMGALQKTIEKVNLLEKQIEELKLLA
jgi:predicted acyltransferase (DUF342 family)